MAKPRITLVSGLGLGDEKKYGEWRYAETNYQLHGEHAKRPLIAQALCDLIPKVRRDHGEVDRVLFVGTAKVGDIWWESGLLKRGFPDTDVDFMAAPEGKTPQENWKILEALEAALGAGDDAVDQPEHFYIEVTPLGYRSTQILAAAAIQRVLSEWARRRRKTPPRLTVFYGAWEAKGSDGAIPIWDVTDLLTAGRWTSAVDAFRAHAQADDLSFLASSLADDWAGDEAEDGNGAQSLADAAQAVARDISFGRLSDLFSRSAPELIAQLDSDATKALLGRLPALSAPLGEARKVVEPLRADNVVGPEGLGATVAYAQLCAALGRFADEAAALREAIVTHYGRSTRRVPMIEPGSKGFGRQRDRIAAELSDLWKRANQGSKDESTAFLDSLPPALRAPVEHLKPLEKVRSDLSRLGLADNAPSRTALRDSLEERLTNLSSLLSGPPAPSAFLNLSDDPVEGWTPEQIEATRTLALGDPLDLLGGLPDVDSEADEEQIEQMARDLASRAIAQGAVGACVDTDASLTFALVAELQARGVRCFAPATKKVTVERDDGKKQTVARFARWRPYARPGAEEE